MEQLRLEADLKSLRASLRHHRVMNLLLGMALSLALVADILLVGSERTYMVPPTISKTFWLTSTKASGAYLEEMASFVGWLILDVAPPTVDWKTKILLGYVAPEFHGEMERQQNIEAERIRRLNATTYFLPMQVVADEAEQTVKLIGRLRTTVNGEETRSDTKAFLASFKLVGGRVQLQKFEEVPYGNEAINKAINHGAASVAGSGNTGQ